MRALLVFLLSLSAAHATTIINVAFDPFSLAGNPGQTITISGTLENTSASTVFIYSSNYSFSNGDPGLVDNSLFLSNAPLSMLPLEVTGTFDFFTIEIPLLQSPGFYSGVFTVLGGDNDLAQDVIGSGSFEVEVLSASGQVPEPASLVLMGAGLGLLVWKRRR